MTQRNPMNERYQNTDDKKMGKTRKSAASAKPATKAASSVHIEKKAPKPKGRFARAQQRAQTPTGKQRGSNDTYYQPNTPEFKKWRRIWWALIIVALAFTSLSFFLTGGFESKSPMYVCLGIGYAALIAAIVIDVTKVRKIRRGAATVQSGSKSKAATAQRKAEKAKRAEEEKLAAEHQKEKEAARTEKKSRGLFGRKKEEDA